MVTLPCMLYLCNNYAFQGPFLKSRSVGISARTYSRTTADSMGEEALPLTAVLWYSTVLTVTVLW